MRLTVQLEGNKNRLLCESTRLNAVDRWQRECRPITVRLIPAQQPAFIDGEGCGCGVLQFAADLSNNLIGKMGSIISDCD